MLKKTWVLFLIQILCLQAAYTEDFELLWRMPIDGMALVVPQTQLQSVVVLSDDNSVKAFSTTGRELWKYKSKRRLLPYLTRSRTSITFICTTTGELSAINRAGLWIWTMNLKEPIVAPVLSGWDGRIFVFTAKRILCYTERGKRLWTKNISSPPASAPIIDNEGNFILVLKNNTLMKVTPFSRSAEIKLTKTVFTLVPLNEKTLVIFNDATLAMYENSKKTKGILEEIPQSATTLAAKVLAATQVVNRVALQLANGTLILLSPDEKKDGQYNKILWTTASNIQAQDNNADKSPKNSYIKYDKDANAIYVISVSDVLAFASDGTALWNMHIENAAVTPAFDSGGILYSGGRDWLLYAYQAEYRRPQLNYLEMQPAGNYGLGVRPNANELYIINLNFGANYDATLIKIRESIERGSLGEDEVIWTKILIAIADDIDKPQDLRVEALELLGAIGSRETVPFLTTLFANETRVSMQSAIVNALGNIGVDNNGRVMDVMDRIVTRRVINHDDVLLVEAAGAIRKLCLFSGPPLSVRGVAMLTKLSTDPSAIVSKRARAELEKLRNAE
jgi:hypothetical protein